MTLKKKKHLILCNLQQFYVYLKNTYPNLNAGLSKFCSQRPKWCIIAGSLGKDMSSCTCTDHQNVKSSDFFEFMTCNMDSYKWMMGPCSDRSDVETFSEMLTEEMVVEIKYKQWVSTDRSNLIDVVQSTKVFGESVVEKLVLKKHHYMYSICKIQSACVCVCVCVRERDELIVLVDFAENYSIEVDSIGVHDKQQFILFPSICRKTTDYLHHNTVTVHTLQKYMVKNIKEYNLKVKTLIHFSDEASTQYKNRKNFANEFV
ncbi:hypothetical protein PR048_002299 [Dryococelus australis]|uniref:Uncharacterized protein n=1 Tax=Dryococelus australis TaxID=614101 RepID=A0ABQ9IJT6_9NEOP|nr:hypothetical protein PR048_002299 [Dryococelus australis]